MECIELNLEHTRWAETIFEESLAFDGLSFRPFDSREAFLDFFMPEREKEYQKISILTVDGSGFASGCYVPGEERAYITYVGVRKEHRRKGIATALLNQLENRLLSNSGVNRTEIVFFNPMTFSWMIPNGNGADHPNAPGIDVSLEACWFFKQNGYQDYALQNSYYRNLYDYQVTEDINACESRLLCEGITFEVYNAENHEGLESMISEFGNPLWEKDIIGEAAKGEISRPILIVSDRGKTVGFTGPLDVEKSGRGFFTGIGVSKAYRGRGIAKVLFCRLCMELKNMDASFMTLFTGELNPARGIYEAAGFQIVKSWADMRKEWKEL